MSKNACVQAAQWLTSSKLKIKIDLSLDISWPEFFNIIKDHGPKNPPQGCNLGWHFHPLSGHYFKKTQLSVLSIYIVVLDVVHPICNLTCNLVFGHIFSTIQYTDFHQNRQIDWKCSHNFARLNHLDNHSLNHKSAESEYIWAHHT